MISCLSNVLRCPFFVYTALLLGSLTVLIAAFAFQYMGYEPCVLCIYQRYPYAIAATLGGLGLVLSYKNKNPAPHYNLIKWPLILAGLVFLVEAALAFYHVGVEQHWWPSHFEACSTPNIEDILTAPAVRCDEVQWQMFGLSMAVYNVGISLIAGLGSLCVAIFLWRQTRTH